MRIGEVKNALDERKAQLGIKRTECEHDFNALVESLQKACDEGADKAHVKHNLDILSEEVKSSLKFKAKFMLKVPGFRSLYAKHKHHYQISEFFNKLNDYANTGLWVDAVERYREEKQVHSVNLAFMLCHLTKEQEEHFLAELDNKVKQTQADAFEQIRFIFDLTQHILPSQCISQSSYQCDVAILFAILKRTESISTEITTKVPALAIAQRMAQLGDFKIACNLSYEILIDLRNNLLLPKGS